MVGATSSLEVVEEIHGANEKWYYILKNKMSGTQEAKVLTLRSDREELKFLDDTSKLLDQLIDQVHTNSRRAEGWGPVLFNLVDSLKYLDVVSVRNSEVYNETLDKVESLRGFLVEQGVVGARAPYDWFHFNLLKGIMVQARCLGPTVAFAALQDIYRKQQDMGVVERPVLKPLLLKVYDLAASLSLCLAFPQRDNLVAYANRLKGSLNRIYQRWKPHLKRVIDSALGDPHFCRDEHQWLNDPSRAAFLADVAKVCRQKSFQNPKRHWLALIGDTLGKEDEFRGYVEQLWCNGPVTTWHAIYPTIKGNRELQNIFINALMFVLWQMVKGSSTRAICSDFRVLKEALYFSSSNEARSFFELMKKALDSCLMLTKDWALSVYFNGKRHQMFSFMAKLMNECTTGKSQERWNKLLEGVKQIKDELSNSKEGMKVAIRSGAGPAFHWIESNPNLDNLLSTLTGLLPHSQIFSKRKYLENFILWFAPFIFIIVLSFVLLRRYIK